MLFIVDMQNDFVDFKRGKNYVNGSEEIVTGIIDKIIEYEQKNDYIFYTSDIKLQGEEEFENNNDSIGVLLGEIKSSIKEKWGYKPYGQLESYLANHEEIKKSYYAIPPEKLLEIQERFKSKKDIIDEIEFVGVETNICVLANAVCVQSAFPDAKIIVNASLCRSSDAKNHEKALEVMDAIGMEIRRWKDETRTKETRKINPRPY